MIRDRNVRRNVVCTASEMDFCNTSSSECLDFFSHLIVNCVIALPFDLFCVREQSRDYVERNYAVRS